MSVASERNMRGSLKPFDHEEHATYDDKGKSAVANFLNKKFQHLRTIPNPDNFGIDLLSLNDRGEVVYCWEVEVRHGNWQGDVKFPFREINCIERKDHQWRKADSFTNHIPMPLASSYKVCYVQLNKECTRAVFIEGDTILKYPLKQWRNRKFDNEYVRQVPIDETIQVKLVA